MSRRNYGVCFLMLISSCAWLAAPLAQASLDNCSGSKSSKAQVLSNRGFPAIQEARTAMEEERYRDASVILGDMVQNDRYSHYDAAKAAQLLAYIYINNDENYAQAFSLSEKIFQCAVLDAQSQQELRYSLTQLSLYLEKYEKSKFYLQEWMANEPEQTPELLFLAARVYAQASNLRQALRYANEGLQQHRQLQGSAPRPDWYRLTLAIRLQNEQFDAALPLLFQMLTHWPDKKELYLQLANLLQQKNRFQESLAVMSIAEINGLFTDFQDYDRLFRQYRFNQLPFRAVLIWNDHSELLPKNDEEFFKQLGDTYSQARHWREARVAYLKSASQSDHGKTWFMLCQSVYREGNFNEAIDYCKKALAKGNLADYEGQTKQLLAASYFQNGDSHQAQTLFADCANYKETADLCNNWITYMTKASAAQDDNADENPSVEKRAVDKLVSDARVRDDLINDYF